MVKIIACFQLQNRSSRLDSSINNGLVRSFGYRKLPLNSDSISPSSNWMALHSKNSSSLQLLANIWDLFPRVTVSDCNGAAQFAQHVTLEYRPAKQRLESQYNQSKQCSMGVKLQQQKVDRDLITATAIHDGSFNN
ncbi:hypothetical protein HAX54_044098 [Datura stramonium]|uniref:Uncharacterized protein n=1 Tax=Datura stramonium TaxID=4076 RepID=A0ABS8W3S5_DATST|nr:hypothetical protein [Datura stramonium]